VDPSFRDALSLRSDVIRSIKILSLLDRNAGQEEEGGERTLETWEAVERQVTCCLIGKGFQFKTFLAMKFTTQHDIY